jgi:hypothetical protein
MPLSQPQRLQETITTPQSAFGARDIVIASIKNEMTESMLIASQTVSSELPSSFHAG